ncbi:IclR family transcriptional regulator [Nonomuraea sp. NPDC050663]|uniref:IclR family transcriptional regulator n=1 Tax=Nonomuraea sp. NPDC050663 TaxID=3364370 RepID=UPI00379EEE91
MADQTTDALPASRAAGALLTGLDVLEALARRPEGLGVTALAREVNADKGNVHRLLRVLEERGYVEQDHATKIFQVSTRMISLAGQVLRGVDLVTTAGPVMRELAVSAGEAVHLARRTRGGGVYVAQERQAGGRITVETEIGAQPVIYASSTGKALYCTATAQELAELLPEPFTAFTMRTHRGLDSLAADLEQVRHRGYAIDDEELNLDVRCVAAPIFNLHGVPLASIGISGPASRITLARIGDLGRLVTVAAFRITQQMGGRVPAKFDAHPPTPTEIHG